MQILKILPVCLLLSSIEKKLKNLQTRLQFSFCAGKVCGEFEHELPVMHVNNKYIINIFT